MYNKLPVKERIELMKSYRKANKDMSYHDMVKDYNDSYQKFDKGGEFNDYTQPGPLATGDPRDSFGFTFPTTVNKNNEYIKENKEPVKTQDTVKERYQAFFPNPANLSDKPVSATPTYYGGKEQNMSEYPMTTAQKLINKAKATSEADRQYNFGKALINVASFVPGPIGYGANMASGAMDIAEGNEVLGAMQFIPNKASKAVSGFNNLMTSKNLYDYGTTPEKTYSSYLPYYTDEYKRKLFKPQSLTNHKYGGIQKFGDGGKYIVKSGDNLSTIAKNYNTDIGTIQKLNNIQDVNKIGVGQNIVLPERQNNIVQQPVNTQQSANLDSYDFNTAFKIARQELGPNKIFEYNGKKFGTNLKGETFVPDKEELANNNMLNDSTLTHLTDQNKKVKSIYTSKETVKLQPTWKESTEIEKQNQEFNKLKNAELINKYQSIRNPNEKYIIVDKKKGKMHVYLGGKEIESYNVGTGENKGDEQTRTWVDKETHKTDWSKGNKQTGAGVYTISFIDEHNKHYGNVPSFHLKNENGVEVPTAIHAGFGDRLKRIANNDLNNNDPESGKDTRFSNGCINGLCKDMTDLYQNDLKADKKGNQGTKVFILPDDDNNFYQIKNGKLNLTTKEYNPNVAYSPKNLKANPVKINVTNEEYNTPHVKGMAYTLEKLKSTLMKDGKIDNDTYNKLSKLVIGLSLQETKGGEDYRVRSGFLKIPFTNKETDQGLVNYLKDLKGSNSINSRGLTQIKYDAQNDELKAQFKKYGVTKDNLNDGAHASIATMLMLSYMYNNELPSLKEKLKKQGISDEEALLYLNQGKKSEIVKGTATPDKNPYIQNVKNFGKNISVQEESY